MSCNIDYLAVIRDGLEEFTGDQFNQLVHDVVGWLADRKLLDETELPIAKGFFDDVLNIMVSTSGKSDVRKKILRKAQATKNPSEAVLWEMRKLLKREIDRNHYSAHQARIYRQVAEAVLALEREGTLQSTMPMKQTEPVKTILALHRDGKSAPQIAAALSKGRPEGLAGIFLTEGDVDAVLDRFLDPRKRVGLASWGDDWLSRKSVRNLDEIPDSLPLIPMYLGPGGQDREAKIFDYSILPAFITDMVEQYGASLLLGKMASVLESMLFPHPYRPDRETQFPSEAGEEDDPDWEPQVQSTIMACAVDSCENEVLTRDLMEKLKAELTSEETEVFLGRYDELSVRSLAASVGCSIATISNRIKSIREKLVSLDAPTEPGSDHSNSVVKDDGKKD